MSFTRAVLVILPLLCFATASVAQTTSAPASSALDGKLYKSVFNTGLGALQPAHLTAVPEPLRSRLARYLDRRAAFTSRYTGRTDSLEAMRVDAKRRAVERSIVALIESPDVEKIAAEFVSRLPVAGEWNGGPDEPVREATYAEDVLKKDPGSPLAPWLYVFIAERQRVAFEASEKAGNDVDGMKAAARKYRTFVDRARAVDDPLFAALVEDLDRQPYLYTKSTTHPRDYDPDS